MAWWISLPTSRRREVLPESENSRHNVDVRYRRGWKAGWWKPGLVRRYFWRRGSGGNGRKTTKTLYEDLTYSRLRLTACGIVALAQPLRQQWSNPCFSLSLQNHRLFKLAVFLFKPLISRWYHPCLAILDVLPPFTLQPPWNSELPPPAANQPSNPVDPLVLLRRRTTYRKLLIVGYGAMLRPGEHLRPRQTFGELGRGERGKSNQQNGDIAVVGNIGSSSPVVEL